MQNFEPSPDYESKKETLDDNLKNKLLENKSTGPTEPDSLR